jgi:opacity protein-like surface antigen
MGWPMTSGACDAASAVLDAPRHSRRASSHRISALRTGLAALALIVAAPAGALAADMPDFLRGSYTPTFARWEGFYFGVQGGESFGSADFGNADNSLVSYMLANTELQGIVSNFTTLPKGSTGSASFGGFIGYNYQWDDVVLGGELNYNHMAIKIGAQDSLGPILVPGASLPDGSSVLYSVTVTSGASLAIHDIVTARARAGWAYDRFLPYGFIGLAVGRADTLRFATLAGSTKTTSAPSGSGTPVALNLPRDPQTQSQNGLIAYGFTAGLGIEAQVIQNLFLRAEWEFIEFPNVDDFRVSTNSARVALGLKF